MLCGYPITATAENWLHECVCQMVQAIHASYDAGLPVPVWPDIIPVARRAQLSSRRGLRDDLRVYSEAAARLSAPERQQVLTCLDQQNRIADLVSCVTNCEKLSSMSLVIRAPVAKLFGSAFGLLTAFGVRDRHYSAIYNATLHHVCPFCGCEYFDAPGAPREDLDHYLAESLYPFAAANLRNLAPMGMKCNERYKLAQDILEDASGGRRRAFDPYGSQRITILLNNSVPFGGADSQTPDWQVEFAPDSAECATWDDVFDIRGRIKRDVLNPSFLSWLGNFAAWFKKHKGTALLDDTSVIDGISEYVEDLKVMELTARESLRTPVFQMLHWHCSHGNDRLMTLLRDLVADAVVQEVAAE